MITKTYLFNGKKLTDLTESEKAECRKEVEGRIHSCGLTSKEYNEIMKLTEPAKKIDLAVDKVADCVFTNACISSPLIDEFKEHIREALKEVYGDN